MAPEDGAPPGFTIDDVRDTFEKDITRSLDRIAEAARDAADRATIAIDGADGAFQTIGEAGHTIHGTSALVSVASLSSSARVLERLAQRGRDEIARAMEHAARARAIAEAARAGADEMRAMVTLELGHRGEDARRVALAWQERARALVAVDGAGPATQPSPERAPAPLDDVLAAALPDLWRAFATECTEILDELDRGVLALEEETAEPAHAIGALRPLYHTLKGVVNTIGLAATGRTIHRVEDLLEGLVEPVAPTRMRDIVTLLLDVHADVRRDLAQGAASWTRTPSVPPGGDPDTDGPSTWPPERAVSDVPPRTYRSERPPATPRSDDEARRVVRVSLDQLDGLMDLAGELVVARSRLGSRVHTLRALAIDLGRGCRRAADAAEDHEHKGSFGAAARGLVEIHARLAADLGALADDADALGRIVTGVKAHVTRARMVPVDVLFSRLRAPIRDAAAREDKDVRVAVRGGGSRLDKAIADALFQPMLHLVRNAVVHGLEDACTRAAAGKPPAGAIELVAREELGQIVVEVRDDGPGLDLARLRDRGVAMGLVSDGIAEDDPSVRDLVFAPGLSTAGAASDVAGRGIGCDFVRRSVERLKGTAAVETAAGRGTRFILTLPATLAITKALLVRQGGQPFAIPLSFAERILDPEDHAVTLPDGARGVHVDGATVRVVHLARFLGRSHDGAAGPIVVLRAGAEPVVVQVDAVTGQEEIVVKSLGAILTGHPIFAGVTIRGTGEMVLILDVAGLAQARPATDGTAHAKRRPIRALFVDDSLSVRTVAQLALAGLGVDVTLAVDGVDALARVGSERFDLVFTDVEMPRMHGLDLIRELRAADAHRDLPIIVLTGGSDPEHTSEARDAGATETMTKPFTPRTLEAAVQRWGRTRRTGAA